MKNHTRHNQTKHNPKRGGRSGARMNTQKSRAANPKHTASKPQKPQKPVKPKKPKTAAAPNSSEYAQVIQWYPGHMTKTKRRIEKDLKLVDAVAEIIDARIPVSSRNPDIARLTAGKPRVVLLNKCDMADPRLTAGWVSLLSRENVKAIPVDCKSGRGVDQFVPALRELLQDRIESYRAKGMVNPSMRVMIVGIPNVGKSTFINRVSKKTKAVSADRPGVTRGNQWFTVSKGFEMLDTPGVLWPRFDDQTVGEHLAFTGAIKSEVMDTELLAVRLIELLKALQPPEFAARYKLSADDLALPGGQVLLRIAENRGMLVAGGAADTERAAYTLLDEFRAAKLGRITLEEPK
ncbi:ribosome biogenesis GTPase YlqF [Ruminococcus sp.]|uniref:ribosome biogenesis GTPase YlqF n=1 Tax=Ruminococcus sp. TaxID=41978 RepID=UPI00388EDF6B